MKIFNFKVKILLQNITNLIVREEKEILGQKEDGTHEHQSSCLEVHMDDGSETIKDKVIL